MKDLLEKLAMKLERQRRRRERPKRTRYATLLERVHARCAVGRSNQCWPWRGAVGERGYGRIKINGRLALTHRVVAFEVGLVQTLHDPERRACVLHRCDNPPCCNPAHLWVGTLSDNMQDCVSKYRHGALTTRANTFGVMIRPRLIQKWAGKGKNGQLGTSQRR
jgi:hypothetical protein